MINNNIKTSIATASKVIGNTWPLYSFVTSNPLSGYETSTFTEATKQASKHLGARVFPKAHVFKQAWDNNEIDKYELSKLLKENGLKKSPETYISKLTCYKEKTSENPFHVLDVIMTKWLAAFMDEGLAEWQMPNKTKGFYKSWRQLAKYDNDVSIKRTNDLPKTKEEALNTVLNGISEEDYTNIFKLHIAALPGWTGYINHRNQYDTVWQNTYPIDLEDYLAVRLSIASNLGIDINSILTNKPECDSVLQLQLIFLKAWEKTLQNTIVELVDTSKSEKKTNKTIETVDAQLVFCIDTRSELIRRHVEAKGNYQTYGYAGFFGIAMDYQDLKEGINRKSCPPILNSAYKVTEKPQAGKEEAVNRLEIKNDRDTFWNYFFRRMKNMLPSGFGFVEGTGVFYGLLMIARTLVPSKLYAVKKKTAQNHEAICETHCEPVTPTVGYHSMTLDEKVAIVKSGFDLMGWKTFAPLIVFTGHGSHTANNPFGSSLDCGACAASPGRHNARLLAKLANDNEVRAALSYKYNISIPNNTVFIGAEHNTTTDEIVLFDSQIPVSHNSLVADLKASLVEAQKTASQQRLGMVEKSITTANKKANSWSETRPEWGLAKNAAFIIGSRELTKGKDLDGRSFLHSYDWEMDKEGKALEGIMQGPMVVTQWINNHYYFSTVDNETFGGGTKITQNITGKFGVLQGNGGDLRMGLPLQSVNKTDTEMYHQPLRLSVLIHAPLERVNTILLNNEHLKSLLDNEWIYLMVMDANDKNTVKRYSKNMNWTWPTKEKKERKARPSTKEEFEKELA
ncbi:MAG: DUF2309 domain-containing protein [Winogradskyella sp.]|uniref:DUF2309 domain-containing protein n=1 Tax=Winogradskyella sp. TaxID=1883156 RepID=UPI00181AFA38|nr:DUF2309 domain-containing protein [Winogradskyella sp.]MBT8246140.1 DUF2309 domain-containing protein [Winogradskyella sp.]NNK23728.1 DUF2309 domain-containing protein [Winogradskyella sp.]